ncbi:sensor histidine kinase [Cohnella silvisoli]|uniref:histidine kinase n=1 Tax=Cohnella silvisoli TaxID=2873699 RepID=A0ABV1KL65_9BACL|nr:histidine kinase [Cohnella silvisoli]MCD9020791.1 hypothetical protein [Cohnella silvisoli]
MKRSTTSLLVWLFACAIILGLFLPSFFIKRNDYLGGQRSPLAALLKNWEVYYGQNPVAGDTWKTFGEAEWKKMSHYEGTLWVRRTLPELHWENPYLYLGGMNRFEAYLDGKSVYRFHMEPGLVWNHFLVKLHPIRINPEDHGKELTLRMKWDRLPFTASFWVFAGDPDQMLNLMLQSDLPRYIYSVLYLTVGLVGIALLARRKERLYVWFTLLALSAGLGLLLQCISLQWFVKVEALYYWKDLLLPFGVYAFTGLYGEVLGASRRHLVQITKNTLFLYTIATLCAGIWSPTWYWKMFSDVLPFLAIAAMGVVTYALVRYRKDTQGQNERKWLLRGYVILVVCGLVHIISIYFYNPLLRIFSLWPYINALIANVLPNGLLLFMLCMVMVLINRVGRVYRESERNANELMVKNSELEQFHRNLEQLVDIRTKELEEASLSLSVTLREKAETLAEVSVLEERNRIAHEMHDVVGHTLTAAIVQLEAGKKLAAREGNLPMDKLETVSALVRKGLDDIRKTVRLLKTDNTPVKLESALQELIRDTIESMEVAIEANIEIPSGLGRLTEQVIYHALQEGLTNGIRHARCSLFRYTLRPNGDHLEFKLWNDGAPYGYSKPGFGLTTMMERVHLLGGTISVGSGKGDGGFPVGCELTITLPLQLSLPSAP